MPPRSADRTALAIPPTTAPEIGQPMRAWLERQVASVALRSYAEAIVESLDSGLAVLDGDLVPTSANEAFRRLIELPPGAPLERPLGELLPLPELVAAARRALESLRPRQNLLLECTGSGRRRLLRANLVPARRPGSAPGLVLAIDDVTDLKILRLAAAHSEDLFRATFEQAAVGIAHLSPAGSCMRVNRRLGEILGASIEDLVGVSLPALVRAGDRPELERGLGELLAGRRPLYSVEHRLERPDAAPVWILLTLSLVLDAAGEPDYFIAVVEDVTAQKSTQEELLTTQEQFRQSQKMEAVGRLAGGVAHDFNNILTAILGYADLLIERVADRPAARDYAVEVRVATERAASLTQQLLAFSRRQVLQPRVLDLNATVREIERMLRRLIGEDIALGVELFPTVGAVLADRSQVEQVLLNLVVNARDAMPEGGVLTIATGDREFAAPTRLGSQVIPPGRYVLLSVGDNGQGMDPCTLEHVFEPFFTTKGAGQGTGLGLSTVHGIVHQSGGYIAVESQVGVGTTFHILLPHHELSNSPTVDEPPAGEPPRGHQTILLVEDDPGVRRLTETVLGEAGYRVLAAGDALAAVDQLRAHAGAIDLLLSDVIMPGLDGRELARLLQAERPGLRVLYMSGYAEDVIVHHGVLDPSVALLHKPFTPAGLLGQVRAALEAPAPR